MADTDGVAMLGFGPNNVTGYVVEDVDEQTEGQILAIADEDGDIITELNNFGIQTSVTVQVIPKSGTAVVSIGDTWSYTSKTHGAVKFSVQSIGAKEVIKDVVKWTCSGNRYPDIVLS